MRLVVGLLFTIGFAIGQPNLPTSFNSDNAAIPANKRKMNQLSDEKQPLTEEESFEVTKGADLLMTIAKSSGQIRASKTEPSENLNASKVLETPTSYKRQKQLNVDSNSIESQPSLGISTENLSRRKSKIVGAINVYKQYRNLTTVNQVWEEFTVGINGNPSVLRLEELYGWNWRRNFTDQNWFYRTRNIYDLVNELRQRGVTDTVAVNVLEEIRVTNGWSLQQLENNIHRIEIDTSLKFVLNNHFRHYQQYRNLTTVNQVWQEYTQGLDGNPSIKSLDEEFGIKWRNDFKAQSVYYRRKRIYDLIKKEISGVKTAEQVVNALELFRVSHGLSLDQLQNTVGQTYLDTDGRFQVNSTMTDFKQYRNLTTVAQVWQEYTIGLNGNPSVKSVELQFGRKWRMSAQDANLFYARKRIYDKVEDLVQKGKPEEIAVSLLDEFMNDNYWSLTKLQRNINVVTDAVLDEIQQAMNKDGDSTSE